MDSNEYSYSYSTVRQRCERRALPGALLDSSPVGLSPLRVDLYSRTPSRPSRRFLRVARRKLSHKDTLSVIRLVGVQASSNVIVEDMGEMLYA